MQLPPRLGPVAARVGAAGRVRHGAAAAIDARGVVLHRHLELIEQERRELHRMARRLVGLAGGVARHAAHPERRRRHRHHLRRRVDARAVPADLRVGVAAAHVGERGVGAAGAVADVGGAAGVGRAGVAVVAITHHRRLTHASRADRRQRAERAVAADLAVLHRRGRAARTAVVTRIDGAGVAVVTALLRACLAFAALAQRLGVAGRAVAAEGVVGQRRRFAAAGDGAALFRAGVVVVAIGLALRLTLATLAAMREIAERGVLADGVVGRGRVGALRGLALAAVDGAGVAVVAIEGEAGVLVGERLALGQIHAVAADQREGQGEEQGAPMESWVQQHLRRLLERHAQQRAPLGR